MVPMNEILLHDVALAPADYYLQTHSTNPLLKRETVSRAIETFLRSLPDFDSLFGVTALQTRLWWADGSAVNHDPAVLARTQDLPPVLEENSNIYLFDRATLERRKNRIGDRPLLFEIPRAEAWDIDEEIDFVIAELLMERSLQRRAA
jgi:CMP-N-acetylneuraminic acid synthetase